MFQITWLRPTTRAGNADVSKGKHKRSASNNDFLIAHLWISPSPLLIPLPFPLPATRDPFAFHSCEGPLCEPAFQRIRTGSAQLLKINSDVTFVIDLWALSSPVSFPAILFLLSPPPDWFRFGRPGERSGRPRMLSYPSNDVRFS